MTRHPDQTIDERSNHRSSPVGKPPQDASFQEIWLALEKLVRLQRHYAELLNDRDGGQRIQFASAGAWLARLRELGRMKTE